MRRAASIVRLLGMLEVFNGMFHVVEPCAGYAACSPFNPVDKRGTMQMKSKAAVFRGDGVTVHVEDILVDPPGANEVMIKVSACGVFPARQSHSGWAKT